MSRRILHGTSTAGRAEDLGDTWFRSMWERNFCRFLKFVGEPYEYEPRTFWFEGIKRGTTNYKPDFYSPTKQCFYEVKGFMDQRSRTALRRMQKYYPSVRIIVIDKAWFTAARRQGLHKIIPYWETLERARIAARLGAREIVRPIGQSGAHAARRIDWGDGAR